MTSEKPPPGWYPDPNNKHIHRFWDGSAWTSKTRKTPLEIVDDIALDDSLPTLSSDPVFTSPRSKTKRNSIIVFVLFCLGFAVVWTYVFIPFSVVDKLNDAVDQEYYRNVLEIGLDEVDFSNETPEMREWYINSWPSIAFLLSSLDRSVLTDSSLNQTQRFDAYKELCMGLFVIEDLIRSIELAPPDVSVRVLHKEFIDNLNAFLTTCNEGNITSNDIPDLEQKIASVWDSYEKFRPQAYADLFVIQGFDQPN